MLQHEPLPNEPRYDAETLRKVTALAQQLKTRQQETLSAREIESIGAEVGLEPRFMQQALAQVTEATRMPHAVHREPGALSPVIRHRMRAFAKAWWAAGWTIPLLLSTTAGAKGAFFLGWLIYLGVGVLISALSQSSEEIRDLQSTPGPLQAGSTTTPPLPAPTRQVSRADLIDALFAIQQALEEHKQHRAFLSVDVVGSTGMKAGADPLVVEHAFGQFRGWLEGIVHAHGGEMQSAAGDGIMCVFKDEASGLRAARELQGSIEGFNSARNRLGQPFAIRCGITAGTVAMEPGVPIGHLNSPVLDRAAAIQKRADPGDILVGSEVAAAALVELGGVAALPEFVNGERVFSWRSAVRS